MGVRPTQNSEVSVHTYPLTDEQDRFVGAGYIALPGSADQRAKQRYSARRTGSMFSGGAPAVGITMERLLEAQAH